MEKETFFVQRYVRYLALAALLCALLELALLLAFRTSLLGQVTVEQYLIGTYVLLIVIFVAIGVGLWYLQRWVHGALIVLCTLGSLLLLTLFLVGSFSGGFLAGLEHIVGGALQPAYATQYSKEIMILLLPFILFFNPFNLWLFSSHVKAKSLFLPPQKDAPALRRKEY
jgi:hypothetical protein